MKTIELTGALLALWVARAVGIRAELEYYQGTDGRPIAKCIKLDQNISGYDNRSTYKPNEDWSQGGPLIETHRILVWPTTQFDYGNPPVGGWLARLEAMPEDTYYGRAALHAAMLALVAGHFGDEIDTASFKGGAA